MKSNNNPLKALVCPLEWGLGHAARCVAVINKLKEEGFDVTIGGTTQYQNYFSSFFNDLNYIDIPAYSIKYSKKFVFISILFQIPLFFFGIFREHLFLSRLLTKVHFAIVISDNRYGMWSRKIKSIIITHQLFIRLPEVLDVFKIPVHYLTKLMIEKFNECWIPDFSDESSSFSGALSHNKNLPGNVKYIGLLSRFPAVSESKPIYSSLKKQILVILSGPESQRSVFENIIRLQAKKIGIDTIIIRGVTGKENKKIQDNNLTLIDHTRDEDFINYIRNSKYIICRAGYSSIMDLSVLGRTALLVPTPGQTEQEYLAKYLYKKGRFVFLNQCDFNLVQALELLERSIPPNPVSQGNELGNAIRELGIKDE